MVSRIPVNFSIESKSYIAGQLNSATCKNWYGTVTKESKFQLPLLPFPGGDIWSDDNAFSAVRNGISHNGNLYFVVGNQFRIYNDNGGYRALGTLATSIGRIQFLVNDTQIGIYDFYNGYVYQLIANESRAVGDFYRIENATSFVSIPVFTGVGINDLTVGGSYIGETSLNYKIQIDGSSSPFITQPTFSGTGLNDMTVGGIYNAPSTHVYKIEIDQTPGSGFPDTFKWSDSNGSSWNAQRVPIVTGAISLNNGITITFANMITHTVADHWTFTAYPAGLFDTFRWSNTSGVSWNSSNIRITGGLQVLESGLEVFFLHTSGHTLEDQWFFSTTTDSVFYPPLVPAYLDTYGIYPRQNTKRFYVTDLEDLAKIRALTYAQANAWPDNLVAGFAINKELILLCEKHIEFWYDIGDKDFPFQPRPNLLHNYGIFKEAAYTLSLGGNNILFWVGQNANGGRVVYSMQSYQVKQISDESLDQKLMDYDFTDSFGYVIEWQGHVFYFLTIPKNDITWVYDATIERWQQRTTLYGTDLSPNISDISTNQYVEGRYIANCHVYHNGMHLVGDWQRGIIYKLSQTSFKDGHDQLPIICEIICYPLNSSLNRISVYSLEIAFQLGVGGENNIIGSWDYDNNPLISLQYSKDGGYTWSKEVFKSLGQKGETLRRVKWNSLGIGRNLIFKIRCAHPVYKVLMGAIIEIEDTGA